MIADAASSVGIVLVSILILTSEWTLLDPIVSFGISFVIIYWAWGILRDSTRVLLEMAPKGMNIEMITEDLKLEFPEIIEFYDVHLWTIIPDMLVYSAHIKIDENKINSNQTEFVFRINDFLQKNHKIIESTIQILPKDAIGACKF